MISSNLAYPHFSHPKLLVKVCIQVKKPTLRPRVRPNRYFRIAGMSTRENQHMIICILSLSYVCIAAVHRVYHSTSYSHRHDHLAWHGSICRLTASGEVDGLLLRTWAVETQAASIPIAFHLHMYKMPTLSVSLLCATFACMWH